MIINNMCDIKDVLLLALLIFAIGSLGVIVNRKSFISLLMSIELMLLSVNINFAALASYHHDYNGQIFVIFILTVAAAEAAVGLAILVAYFRNRDSIDTASANHLRG